MSLQIGRVGIDLTLDPMTVQLTGLGTVNFAGEVSLDDAVQARSLRDELHRMVDNDDLILPVVWTADASFDGYYRVLGANLNLGIASLNGWYPFTCQLERMGSDGLIAIESRLQVGLRANAHSITLGSSEPIHGVPDTHKAYNPDTATPTTMTRTLADGTVRVFRDMPQNIDPVWGIAAANFYKSACQIEVGVTLRVVAGLDADNLPDDWRINNAAVRVSPNGTSGRLDVAHFDGTIWETAKVWEVRVGGTEVGQWDNFSVLRNDASTVIVRLNRRDSEVTVVTLDLTLKRGSRFVEARITRNVAAAFKIVRNTTEAATTLTGAIRATVNDGDGNRYVLGSSKAVTDDLVEGGITSASLIGWDFFIGSAIAGSSAVAGDAPADLVNQYHGYVTEVMNPVRR